MTSASDQTDDRVIVPPGEADEQIADAQIIQGSIIHDDGPGPVRPAGATPADGGQARPDLPRRVRTTAAAGPEADEPTAEPAAEGPTADEPAAGGSPRRAWIPETLVPGPRQPETPVAAQSVPNRPTVPEPELDEPAQADPDQPEPESARDATGFAQPAADQPAAEEPAADKPAADKPAVDEPVAEQPAAAQPAADQSAGKNPWPAIQSMFVDDPRQAVEQAARVTTTALADLISAAKKLEQTLRSDWTSEHTGTEELRVALRGYRDLAARIATLTRGF